jgi:hypothetical protein
VRYELTADDAERFWPKVNRDGDGCWLWNARLFTQTGYGLFTVRCDDGKWRPTTAHRVSYQLTVGPIPDRFHVDHLCRVRPCVRPEHLEAVTQRENVLRGDGLSAIAARRDCCVKGHPYTAENTYIRPAGHRECRACARENDMRRVRSEGPCVICKTPFTSHNHGVVTCSRECTAQLVWRKRRAT